MAGSAQVIANMYKWAEGKRAGVEGVARVTGANMQNYARATARWQPNWTPPKPMKYTGNARAGLNGGSFWQNPFILMVFIAHSMSYGPYLEFAMDRRFAILEESRDKFKDSFFQGVKRIMEH